MEARSSFSSSSSSYSSSAAAAAAAAAAERSEEMRDSGSPSGTSGSTGSQSNTLVNSIKRHGSTVKGNEGSFNEAPMATGPSNSYSSSAAAAAAAAAAAERSEEMRDSGSPSKTSGSTGSQSNTLVNSIKTHESTVKGNEGSFNEAPMATGPSNSYSSSPSQEGFLSYAYAQQAAAAAAMNPSIMYQFRQPLSNGGQTPILYSSAPKEEGVRIPQGTPLMSSYGSYLQRTPAQPSQSQSQDPGKFMTWQNLLQTTNSAASSLQAMQQAYGGGNVAQPQSHHHIHEMRHLYPYVGGDQTPIHTQPVVHQGSPNENSSGAVFKRKNAESQTAARKKRSKSGHNSSSEYRGVSWHKRDKRWIARGWVKGKTVNLGSYLYEKQAALAVDVKTLETTSPSAIKDRSLNFPSIEERSALLGKYLDRTYQLQLKVNRMKGLEDGKAPNDIIPDYRTHPLVESISEPRNYLYSD